MPATWRNNGIAANLATFVYIIHVPKGVNACINIYFHLFVYWEASQPILPR